MAEGHEHAEESAPPAPVAAFGVPAGAPATAAPGPARGAGALAATGVDSLRAWDQQARARQMLSLQRSMGNAALARMVVARVTDEDLAAKADASDAQGGREPIDAALQSRDAGDVKAIADFGLATGAEKVELIGILLDQGWVGPYDEWALEAIWDSYQAGIAKAGAANSGLWKQCIDRGMNPSNIGALETMRTAFEADVKAIAKAYMQTNLAFADAEMVKLGFSPSADPAQETTTALHQQKTVDLARQAKRALEAQDALKTVPVGYDTIMHPMAGGARQIVQFDPTGRPPMHRSGGFGFQEGPPTEKSWEECKAEWDRTETVLAAIGAQSPTVFAAVAGGREDVGALAGDDPQQAVEAARRVLTTLRANIDKTIPKVDTGDLDWRDLKPIHDQLYGGRETGSGIEWQSDFAKSVAQDVIGDHETTEFWISLGLGTVAAAAFIVAELATGGLATAALVGGIGVGAGQAARSWESWEDLSTAAKGAASEGTRLVSQGQADAALLSAILDTVFFFLDIAGPVFKGAKAAKSAAELGETALERSAIAALGLQELGEGAEAALRVERAIGEAGVQATLDRTGKTADELIAVLQKAKAGADPAVAGRLDAAIARLAEGKALGLVPRSAEEIAAAAAKPSAMLESASEAEKAWAGSRPLGDLLREAPDAVLSGKITKQLADRLLSEAVDTLGPVGALKQAGGWKALSRVLGADSPAGRKLMQWRNAVFEDLQSYAEKELGGQVQRTGSVKDFSNDIDMSFIGANAAEVREGAMRYLAAKLGTGSDPGSFNHLMLAGLFTDPRRSHAYDALPAALREKVAKEAAAKQEQIVWNRRLFDATQAGDDAMAKQIRAEMGDLGIPEYAFRPLGADDAARLAQRQDQLWGELEAAIKAGDGSKTEALARKLGEAQALINASSPDGYITSGGTRRWVSERTGDQAVPRIGPEAGKPFSELTRPEVEKLTQLIDQLPQLDHAVLDLPAVSGPMDLLESIRGVGKYGGRVGEMAGEAGAGGFDDLLKRCAALKKSADDGGELAKVLAGQADQAARDARALAADVIAKHSEIIAQVRQAAQLPEVGARAAANLEILLKAHVKLLRATDAMVANVNVMARAIRTGTALGDRALEEATEPAP